VAITRNNLHNLDIISFSWKVQNIRIFLLILSLTGCRKKKMKNKTDKFRAHKKELIEIYSISTVNSWIYTKRLPRYETAVELSPIIKLHIKQIPYFYFERG
jgi:hypothetical protein